jgi:cellulose synthase/poly-beta-1,6-N-acetylglucosamine synthase-like glycosyltransferase
MTDDSKRGLPEASAYEYERFSTLAGDLTDCPDGSSYSVEFRQLGHFRPVRTAILAAFALLCVGGFFTWMLLPEHWPNYGSAHPWMQVASIAIVVNTALIGLFTIVNVATLCRASMAARDPIPVRAEPGTRVAFLTTIVPEKEPVDMVRRTLEAACEIRHDGPYDVWLMDEGNEPAVRQMCAEVGVHHFSRRGIERYNTVSGKYKAKTKHGNYNAWLDTHGEDYDYFISVDPDHVPAKNYIERFLGYLRDPDVAFVVGPQVYGNQDTFLTRAAESQQFLFHSLLQRAGNLTSTPMLVGTNNAVRISALNAIGGLTDSVTEDMATSLTFHTSRNPDTGARWKSVYTPDVIAIGEGPSSFTDFFAQQHRWSQGTDDVVVGRYWRLWRKLGPRRLWHYTLLMSYYPTTALAWMLGVVNAVLFLTLHVGGVTVPIKTWLMLYVDAAALQTALYYWNRRHNVSPHERVGTSGLAGMFISALSAPIYVSSLLCAVFRRQRGFVVTTKGISTQADTLRTFRTHLQWAAVLTVPLVASIWYGNPNPWMYGWSGLGLLVCLLPIVIWRFELRSSGGLRRRRRAAAAEPASAERTTPLEGGMEAA